MSRVFLSFLLDARRWGGLLLIAVGGWSSPAAGTLTWETGPDWRKAQLLVANSDRTGFTRLGSALTAITFTNSLSDERSITNRNLLSGSGVAAGDVDGDGWCDLYFCSLGTGNVLFRNRGSWRFEDITQAAGVACPGQDSTGAVFADVDGDGDVDLLVNALGRGTRLFQNDGHGRFRETTAEAGLRSRTGSTSMALADIEGDGDLDLYVANFRPETIKDQPTTRFRIRADKGTPIVTAVNDRPATAPDLTNRFVVMPSGTVLEQGEPDVLYLNDGEGKFTPLSFTGGSFLDEDGAPLREPPRDWGLAVQFHDLNGDSAPDLYVCNDLHTPDRIWINDGRGRFRAIADEAIRCTSVFSMGVDIADVNRDGHNDIFVVDMFSREHVKRHVQVATSTPMRWPVGAYKYRPQINRNTLQINRGDGTFAETAWFSGVEASEWSWGPIFLDVDLDGYEDIVVMNGQLRDFQNADLDRHIAEMRTTQRLSMIEILRLVKLFPRLESAKLIFRNRGDLTFEEVGARWGFDSSGIAQGMALADLDNDGDLDIVTNNLNEAAGLYRNETSRPRLAVRLQGRGRNKQGVGARIQITAAGLPVQSQEIICGGRYLSGDDALRTFAAGAGRNTTIEVTWRGGGRSRVENAQPNCVYVIGEPEARGSTGSPPPGPGQTGTAAQPLFQEVTDLLRHVHEEEPFDDFARQPLLPNRMSQLGPGVCWQDLDGDGWDDLIIASGRGGNLAVFRNDGKGGFTRVTEPLLTQPAVRDQTSVLVPALHTVLVGSANYEDGQTNGGAIRIYDLGRKVAGEAVLGRADSTGPLAMADIDGDDDLDLFIGGRVIPGRYPEPAASLLMRNEGGRLILAQRWDRLGLVSGAVFTDVSGDGAPDLVLACEWGSLRVLENRQGVLTDVTDQRGLGKYKGWWRGVAAGDLDGDGSLDLVASNWGLNTMYRITPDHPRRLFYGDLDDNGVLDVIDTKYDPALARLVPERGFRAVAAAMPFLQETVGSFEAYATASVEELYGSRLSKTAVLEASILTSMVFFNRGGYFEAAALPPEAQWAPAFGITVTDVNGDGAEDVFLSQNFSAVNPDNQPCSAGRGLWLKGDGRGTLVPMPGQETGVMVYGEQRGCAVADYDQDGRVDLVVTQNGNATRLYRNVGAKPGLRVRLQGPPGNPAGVGAVLRLGDGQALGPAREVHAGSGYLSQDSPIQVLSFNGAPRQLRVRWPGGKETVASLPENAGEVSLNPAGVLHLLKSR